MDDKTKELVKRWHKAFNTTIKEAVEEVEERLEWTSVEKVEHAIAEQERNNHNAALLTAAGITEAFVWGKIITVHTIGDIAIIEHDNEEGEREYHPYAGGKDTCSSDSSLDGALLMAIGYKYEGPGGHFARYAGRMLNMGEDS